MNSLHMTYEDTVHRLGNYLDSEQLNRLEWKNVKASIPLRKIMMFLGSNHNYAMLHFHNQHIHEEEI